MPEDWGLCRRCINRRFFYALDENGRIAEDITAQCTVAGEGTLMGWKNGVIWDLTGYCENRRRTRCGRMIAYIRTYGSDCQLTARSKETGCTQLSL